MSRANPLPVSSALQGQLVQRTPSQRRRVSRAFFRVLGHPGATVRRGFLRARAVCLTIGDTVYEVSNRDFRGRRFDQAQLDLIIGGLWRIENRRREREPVEATSGETQARHLRAADAVYILEFEADVPPFEQARPSAFLPGAHHANQLLDLQHLAPSGQRQDSSSSSNSSSSSDQDPFSLVKYVTAPETPPYRPFYTFYDGFSIRYDVHNPCRTEPIPEEVLLNMMDLVMAYGDGEETELGKVKGTKPADIDWLMTELQHQFYHENQLWAEDERRGNGSCFVVVVDEKNVGRLLVRQFFVKETAEDGI